MHFVDASELTIGSFNDDPALFSPKRHTRNRTPSIFTPVKTGGFFPGGYEDQAVGANSNLTTCAN